LKGVTNKMRAPLIQRTLLFSGLALLGAIAMGTQAMPPAHAAPADRCHGTKKWYEGQCRYPDDIARLEAEKQLRRRAEQQRREAEEKRKAEEERQRAQEQQAKDMQRCARARELGTTAAWEAYKADFPEGMCRVEAGVRIAELREAHRVKPSPPSQPGAKQAGQNAAGTPPPAEELAGAAPQAEDESSHNVPLTLGWVSVGLAGVGLGLGIGFAVSASAAKDDFDDDPTVDNADRADRATLISLCTFGAGGLFSVVGAALLTAAYDDDPPETAQRIPTIAPLLGPTVGGVAASWTF